MHSENFNHLTSFFSFSTVQAEKFFPSVAGKQNCFLIVNGEHLNCYIFIPKFETIVFIFCRRNFSQHSCLFPVAHCWLSQRQDEEEQEEEKEEEEENKRKWCDTQKPATRNCLVASIQTPCTRAETDLGRGRRGGRRRWGGGSGGGGRGEKMESESKKREVGC